jgi:hypothetical protein
MGSRIKMLRLFSFILIVLAVAVLPSSAESNAWDGTWKLNEAKSRLGGPTFILTISPKGEFQMVTASLSYKFYCDGKYRLVTGHRTLACVKATATTVDVVEKDNDKLIGRMHRELSADGKTLTQTATEFGQSQSQKSVKRVFARYSKSTGLAGAWSDASELDRQPQVMVTVLANSTLHLSFPREKQYTEARLDGSDAPTHGVAEGARITLSVTPEGSQKLLTVQKLNGTVLNNGTLMLSSDGRSITEETWKADAPKVKSRLVYEKQ